MKDVLLESIHYFKVNLLQSLIFILIRKIILRNKIYCFLGMLYKVPAQSAEKSLIVLMTPG